MKQKALDFYTEQSKIFSDSELASIAEKMILDEGEHQLGVYLYQLASGKNEDLFETAEELLENYDLSEAIKRHVDASGNISRRKDRKTRERQATAKTGLSKSRRRQIARKTAKTKKARRGDTMRATRKRKRAIKKRTAMGLDRK